MPTTLPPVLLRAPVVERQTLTLTSPWLQWFEQSYVRQGGQEAATNTELAGGVAGNADHISEVEAGLGQTNTTVAGLEEELSETQTAVVDLFDLLEALTARVDTIETDLTALQTRVEALETTVADQETRLAALEAWKTAMQAALPGVLTDNTGGTANNTVALVPNPAAAPATATALRDDLVTNVWPTLKDNYADLTDKMNALRAALLAS